MATRYKIRTEADISDAQLSALHGVNDANTTSNSYADGKVEDSIVDGHTTIAPSGNAVFDALALKAPAASPTFTTKMTGSFLTASEMLVTNASKEIVSAPVATYPSLTELSYVKGVTSAIQTQLNNKAPTTAASTSGAGLAPQATVPAAGLTNVVAIENGETVYKNKALYDATAPSTQAFGDTAAVGTAVTAARRDHKHAMMAAPTTISGNAGTATKLETARTFTVTDNDATNSQASATNFDGSGNFTLKLPATIKAAITGTASGNLVAADITGKVDKSTYNANSILAATTDDTPAAVTVAEQTVVGRITGGNIKALSTTEIRTLINVADGATANAKASSSDIDTGSDDTKFATAKAIADSKLSFTDGTETLTNKRINSRVVSTTSYTTDTGTSLNIANCDMFIITAQAGALKFNNPGGTPTEGQKLMIRIKDNGTAVALTYDTQFRAMGVALPSTTVLSKTMYMGFIFNITDTKRDLISMVQEA